MQECPHCKINFENYKKHILKKHKTISKLKKCYACNNSISKKAKMCPNCGEPQIIKDKCNKEEEKKKDNVFIALSDFSFSSFVTIELAKFAYIISILLSTFFCGFLLVQKFKVSSSQGMIYLFISPLILFVSILLARVSLEMTVAIFKIAENTSKIVDHIKED